ncbi:MAG TPA: class I SAM-dependent methyltransferase, partial [Anaerolineales bacterium]|nr:class I SAM-dependent methyltransferase [Anaerolineales bacterium]
DPLKDEWRARQASLRRLTRYLSRIPRPLRVLELGCGNGWLSRHLAAIPDARVCGLDQNPVELAQAARLFTRQGLRFLKADIFIAPFPDGSFDAIVMASVIQYFPDLPALFDVVRRMLRAHGELHIMDSPLYQASDVEEARQRTRAYYAGLGVPQMADHYHHHLLNDVQPFSPRWHYRPAGNATRLTRILGRVDSPFPWFSICWD